MFLESKTARAAAFVMLPFAAWAQSNNGVTIYLTNPSFEGYSHAGQIDEPFQMSDWYDCASAPQQSPPDVQTGQFQVGVAPNQGNTYLGLVVRSNGTWEGIGQRLSRPLEKGQCYEFSLFACRAILYKSRTTFTRDSVNFTAACRLLIWGGNGYCHKGELIGQTNHQIVNSRWLKTDFRLSPKAGNWSHIMIEAYYGLQDPFNPAMPMLVDGNVLIDNVSPIRQVPCEPEKMPDMKSKPPVLTAKGPAKKPAAPEVKTASTPSPTTPAKQPKRGRSYRLDVYFKTDEYTFDPGLSEKSLEDLYDMLRNDPNISIEIGGHTNNLLHPYVDKAMELSTRRAKSVADWLISKGVDKERVQYKGYGWANPVEPNITPEGRKRNQRVEVTILTFE